MEHSSDSQLQRPGMRLGVVVVLGLLGAWMKSAPGLLGPQGLSVVQGAFPSVWLAMAFGSVLLLHRLERVKTPRRLGVFMGLALAASLLRPLPAGMHDFFDRGAIAKVGVVGLLVLMAGASMFGLPFLRGGSRPWSVYLLRGPALAFVSPLLLFASRPRGSGPLSSRVRLLRAAFAVFLYALASPLLFFADNYCSRFMLRYFGIDLPVSTCGAFGLWAWAGCAVLFLLTPWQEAAWLASPRVRARGFTFWLCAGVGLLAAALIAMVDEVRGYTWILLCLGSPAWALLLIVGPFPRVPFFPKLAEPDPSVKLGALGTLGFLVVVLSSLFFYFVPYFLGLVSGTLFFQPFRSSAVKGWALDQSTVQSGFWRFSLLAGMMAAGVAVAGWLSDRSSRRGFWAFALPVISAFIVALSYLTCNVYMLFMCVWTMGFTLLRICGLAYGLGCYLVVLAFLRSVVRTPWFVRYGKDANV